MKFNRISILLTSLIMFMLISCDLSALSINPAITSLPEDSPEVTALEETLNSAAVDATLVALNTPIPSATTLIDTPLATSTLAPSLTSTPTSTSTPTPTFTATKVASHLTVSVPTYCRTGPGKIYPILGTIEPNQVAEIIGRDVYSDTWNIHLPSNPTVTCWVWGHYATVFGDVSTPTSTLTSISIPTLSFTATKGVAQLTVSVPTYCRTGPGKVYPILGTIELNQVAEIVGRDASSNTWFVHLPGNPTVTCWVWGQYATIDGNLSGVPFMTPPPTP